MYFISILKQRDIISATNGQLRTPLQDKQSTIRSEHRIGVVRAIRGDSHGSAHRLHPQADKRQRENPNEQRQRQAGHLLRKHIEDHRVDRVPDAVARHRQSVAVGLRRLELRLRRGVRELAKAARELARARRGQAPQPNRSSRPQERGALPWRCSHRCYCHVRRCNTSSRPLRQN